MTHTVFVRLHISESFLHWNSHNTLCDMILFLDKELGPLYFHVAYCFSWHRISNIDSRIDPLTLKGPVPYIYGTHQCGQPRLHSFAPHWSRACPALPTQLARTWAVALSHRGPTQAAVQSRSQWTAALPGAATAFPVWVPRFQATGSRYTSRKSCVHTFIFYSTCLIGNLSPRV